MKRILAIAALCLALVGALSIHLASAPKAHANAQYIECSIVNWQHVTPNADATGTIVLWVEGAYDSRTNVFCNMARGGYEIITGGNCNQSYHLAFDPGLWSLTNTEVGCNSTYYHWSPAEGISDGQTAVAAGYTNGGPTASATWVAP